MVSSNRTSRTARRNPDSLRSIRKLSGFRLAVREVRFEETIFAASRAEPLRETPTIGCSAWARDGAGPYVDRQAMEKIRLKGSSDAVCCCEEPSCSRQHYLHFC